MGEPLADKRSSTSYQKSSMRACEAEALLANNPSRQQLQRLAKSFGIKANLSSASLREQLAACVSAEGASQKDSSTPVLAEGASQKDSSTPVSTKAPPPALVGLCEEERPPETARFHNNRGESSPPLHVAEVVGALAAHVLPRLGVAALPNAAACCRSLWLATRAAGFRPWTKRMALCAKEAARRRGEDARALSRAARVKFQSGTSAAACQAAAPPRAQLLSLNSVCEKFRGDANGEVEGLLRLPRGWWPRALALMQGTSSSSSSTGDASMLPAFARFERAAAAAAHAAASRLLGCDGRATCAVLRGSPDASPWVAAAALVLCCGNAGGEMTCALLALERALCDGRHARRCVLEFGARLCCELFEANWDRAALHSVSQARVYTSENSAVLVCVRVCRRLSVRGSLECVRMERVLESLRRHVDERRWDVSYRIVSYRIVSCRIVPSHRLLKTYRSVTSRDPHIDTCELGRRRCTRAAARSNVSLSLSLHRRRCASLWCVCVCVRRSCSMRLPPV